MQLNCSHFTGLRCMSVMLEVQKIPSHFFLRLHQYIVYIFKLVVFDPNWC